MSEKSADASVVIEDIDVYESMGLPHPFTAFTRARQNIQYFTRGRWRRIWWVHRIEPAAATHCGISVIKLLEHQQAYELFLKSYAGIAARLETDSIEVNVFEGCLSYSKLSGDYQRQKLKQLRKKLGY